MKRMEMTDGTTVVNAVYSIEYCVKFMASMIPVGVGLGMIPLIFGLGISGVVKIFKNV